MFARLQRVSFLLLLAVTCSLPTGCAWMRNMFVQRDPFGPTVPCAIPPDSTAAEVVAFLNLNTARVQAWRADRVSISSRGSPFSANASLLVEAPRNFRLRVDSTFGPPEVDIGSNNERFWVWNRRAEDKCVAVAYHDGESVEKSRFPIPFDPDWIMEALGVVPIDPARVALHPGPSDPSVSRTAQLVSDTFAPDGAPVKKVIIVDLCHGRILEHALFDERGALIARARLIGHFRDTRSGGVLPSQIDLDWPQAQLSMTMKLGKPPAAIVVNPPRFSDDTWSVPHMGDIPIIELNRRGGE